MPITVELGVYINYIYAISEQTMVGNVLFYTLSVFGVGGGAVNCRHTVCNIFFYTVIPELSLTLANVFSLFVANLDIL